ncbi:MAG TPA: hypothetical protein VIH61_06930 [Waddliaceae bacterium]
MNSRLAEDVRFTDGITPQAKFDKKYAEENYCNMNKSVINIKLSI